jgi:hypothetical protein
MKDERIVNAEIVGEESEEMPFSLSQAREDVATLIREGDGDTAQIEAGTGERWKPVPGWEMYEVSDAGRLIKIKKNRRRPVSMYFERRNSLLKASVYDGSNTGCVCVGNAVLRAFGGEPPTAMGYVTGYINGNRADCRIGNLRWISRSEAFNAALKRQKSEAINAALKRRAASRPAARLISPMDIEDAYRDLFRMDADRIKLQSVIEGAYGDILRKEADLKKLKEALDGKRREIGVLLNGKNPHDENEGG